MVRRAVTLEEDTREYVACAGSAEALAEWRSRLSEDAERRFDHAARATSYLHEHANALAERGLVTFGETPEVLHLQEDFADALAAALDRTPRGG